MKFCGLTYKRIVKIPPDKLPPDKIPPNTKGKEQGDFELPGKSKARKPKRRTKAIR